MSPFASLHARLAAFDPGLRDYIGLALLDAGLAPDTFRTETTGPTVRVTFHSNAAAAKGWDALAAVSHRGRGAFDLCTDGPAALRVGWAWELQAREAA